MLVQDAQLRYLHMKNFRQHTDTELTFPKGKQIILLSGANGHGKTSILEALVYALYGVPRQTRPRTKLDSLVRWGCELEGMLVELSFEMGEDTYTIQRRFVQGNSQAVLAKNGQATHNSPKEVTQKVSELFGMTLKPFRMAVVSEQKELDGLTSMDSAERMRTVSKISGLDVLTQSAKTARELVNRRKDDLRVLGDDPDVAGARQDLAEAQELFTQLNDALIETNDSVKQLEERLSAGAEVTSKFQKASNESAAAQAAKLAAERQLAALQQEAESAANLLAQTPAPTATQPVSELITAKDAAHAEVEAVHSHNSKVAERAAQQQELSRLHSTAATITQQVTGAEAVIASEPQLLAERDALSACKDAAVEAISAAEQQVAVYTSQAAAVAEQLEQVATLGATCPECGQVVDESHKESHLAQLTERQQQVADSLAAEKATLADARSAHTTLRESIAALTEQLQAVSAAKVAHSNAVERLAATQNAASTLEQTIASLPENQVNPEGVELKFQVAADALQAALAAQEAVAARERLSAKLTDVLARVASAETAAQAARTAAVEKAVPEQLLEQVEFFADLANKLSAEKDLAHESSVTAAKAEQAIELAKERLQYRESEKERREEIISALDKVRAAHRLLSAVATQEAAALRPSLEGIMSSILDTMSSGLYSKVVLSKDYSISVEKSGEPRPMHMFSGGEKDMMGVAMRLALAQTVAARNGGTGPGFLILDEVLGSQDPKRQAAVFNTLRSMKATYPQIFIISHTEGAEDLADVVFMTSTLDTSKVLESTVTEL